jgi:hypothetical protein
VVDELLWIDKQWSPPNMSELWLWNLQPLLTRNHVWMNALGSHYEAVEIRLGQGGWGGLEVSTSNRK